MWLPITILITILGAVFFLFAGMGIGFTFGKKEQEEIDHSVVNHYFQQDRGDA